MKIRHCAALLIALLTISLLAGCYTLAMEQSLEKAEEAVEHRLEAVEEAVEAAILPEEKLPLAPAPAKAEPEPIAVSVIPDTPVPAAPAAPEILPETAAPEAAPAAKEKLTVEQARTIALEHAGFRPEEVRFLRAEYEVDDRIPQYDIEFDVDRWEYEYEIHAESGAVLSAERDD